MSIDFAKVEKLRRDPLPPDDAILRDDRVIGTHARYRVVYGPFLGLPNPAAELLFVGLTPGLQQLEIANRVARENPGLRDIALDREIRKHAAFAGSMRTNLVNMLDRLGLASHLGIDSTADLFESSLDRIATTSALLFPVFKEGENYRGDANILKLPLLREMIDRYLSAVIVGSTNARIIPLGKWATQAVLFAARGKVDPRRVLVGFPHPSGANGHRLRLFNEAKDAMRAQIERWYA